MRYQKVKHPIKGQNVTGVSSSLPRRFVSLYLILYVFLFGASFVGVGGGAAKAPTASGAGASVAQSVPVNVKEFGARGDGVADDTLAFKKAFRQLESTEQNIIDIPAGRYLLDSRALRPDPDDPGEKIGVRVTR